MSPAAMKKLMKMVKKGYDKAVESASETKTIAKGEGKMEKVKMGPSEAAKVKNKELMGVAEKSDYSETAKAGMKKQVKDIVGKGEDELRVDEAFGGAADYTDKMHQKGVVIPRIAKKDASKSAKLRKMLKQKGAKLRADKK